MRKLLFIIVILSSVTFAYASGIYSLSLDSVWKLDIPSVLQVKSDKYVLQYKAVATLDSLEQYNALQKDSTILVLLSNDTIQNWNILLDKRFRGIDKSKIVIVEIYYKITVPAFSKDQAEMSGNKDKLYIEKKLTEKIYNAGK